MSQGLERSLYGLAPLELYEFLQGATAWRYTSGDRAVTHLGHEYLPRAIARKEIRHSQEESTGSVELTLPKTDPVALLFRGHLPPRPLSLTIWRVQRQDLLGGAIFTGSVSSVSFEGAIATLKCAPLEELLNRPAPGLVFQSQCNWVLYGAGCGVSAAAFRHSGHVARIEGLALHVAGVGGKPDGWFRAGYVLSAAGDRRFVVNHTGEVLTLNAPFDGLAVGDLVSVYAGCQRTEADCQERFDNLDRFFGFPRMPSRNAFLGTV